MSQINTIKKYAIILEEFTKRVDRTLTSYDVVLLDELGISQKQLGRLLDELSSEFDNIITLVGKKRKTYKLIQPIDLFVQTMENSQEIGWFFNMATEADPLIFKELENYTNKNKNIYQFKNSPFEDITSLESKQVFKRVKSAVENHEYRDIKFSYEQEWQRNLRCLKLVFMDNNWYVAFVDEKDALKFGRISFIQEVSYSKNRTAFQIYPLQKQMDFLENSMQNSMTLYDTEQKTATLKAKKEIARYFQKGMKKFLSSQEFGKELKNGDIVFTVDYTQELEILPLVQRWLPGIEILSPDSLKTAYKEKLKKALL